MADSGPPAPGLAGLGHRQVVLCLPTAFVGLLLAWNAGLPQLQASVAQGRTSPAHAIESAAAMAGGLTLASLGAALPACILYNRLRRERGRRRAAATREVEFLSSLGHSISARRPFPDRQTQD